METVTTEKRTEKHETPPQNRKDLIIMSLMAIRDANARGDIEGKIDAYTFFFENALPELPKECVYDRRKPFTLKPTFDEVKKEYLNTVPLLFPELIQRNIPKMIRWQQDIHLIRLHDEAAEVQRLLKEYTGWMFDKESQLSAGK